MVVGHHNMRNCMEGLEMLRDTNLEADSILFCSKFIVEGNQDGISRNHRGMLLAGQSPSSFTDSLKFN